MKIYKIDYYIPYVHGIIKGIRDILIIVVAIKYLF